MRCEETPLSVFWRGLSRHSSSSRLAGECSTLMLWLGIRRLVLIELISHLQVSVMANYKRTVRGGTSRRKIFSGELNATT